MNKRILELAKQSGLIKYESDGKMEEVEKFAELIVWECAKEAFNFWCYQDDSNDESAQSHIKKHFGIEE